MTEQKKTYVTARTAEQPFRFGDRVRRIGTMMWGICLGNVPHVAGWIVVAVPSEEGYYQILQNHFEKWELTTDGA